LLRCTDRDCTAKVSADCVQFSHGTSERVGTSPPTNADDEGPAQEHPTLVSDVLVCSLVVKEIISTLGPRLRLTLR
jgi:hypothetical protein